MSYRSVRDVMECVMLKASRRMGPALGRMKHQGISYCLYKRKFRRTLEIQSFVLFLIILSDENKQYVYLTVFLNVSEDLLYYEEILYFRTALVKLLFLFLCH